MLDDDFFRREAGRLLAALTRVFGVQNLALAEDVTQETLARAFEVFRLRGVPEHYSALLMTSAKNRALDVLRRERNARRFAPELARLIDSEWTLRPAVEELFLPEALRDDELRMMFTCCHPRLPEEAQLALILNVLGGLHAREIAAALFASEAAIEKRLARGKKVLAESQRLFELTSDDVDERRAVVHRALYLLFNEGYHGSRSIVRIDLCREALRLVRILEAHATEATHALAALMCLHAARLPARIDEAGNLTGLFDQDRAKWDRVLITEGLEHLSRSARGDALTEYHLEAAIAAHHATSATRARTPWREIVELYDALVRRSQSPVVALNRAIAIAELEGPERGIAAIGEIDPSRLARYPFYEAALGELELRRGRREEARAHLLEARRVARNDAERSFIDKRLAAI